MSTDPNLDRAVTNRIPTMWLWAIIGVAIALLLSWFTRFPWG
jgi:hypothetical protein